MNTSDPSEALFFIESELEESPSQSFDRSVAPKDFNEAAYLRAFPDVARAIRLGERESGLDHFWECGLREGRLSDLRYIKALVAEDAEGLPVATSDTSNFPAVGIDALFTAPSGRCLVIGWLNEEPNLPITAFLLVGGSVVASTREIARCRRRDAEAVVFPPPGKLLGFWTVLQVAVPTEPAGPMSIALVAGEEQRTIELQAQRVSEDRLREIALEYMCSAQYYSNPQVEAHIQLEGGLGKRIIDMNVEISRKVIASAFTMKFGSPRAKIKASIVVCLYGKAEFLYLQAAFFSMSPELGDYEFIYVSNSPELAEILVKESTLAARIYGTSITLVILSGNAGFGAANNVAVSFAQSKRILIVNPDVFPRSSEWARQHSAIVRDRPADQVTMFGVPLYYDDGSLMHAGMYVVADTALAVRQNGVEQRSMLRVEHYGKGAPPDTGRFLQSRIVPAVTGAFMSIDRSWFEALGGFSLEYVFGHYEDADLCLKSYQAGKPVWVHNVPFWHLEGKGSTRRPVHEGGSTVNRWHFTNTWAALIEDGLEGPAPRRLRLS
jgi:GT2 family glycosyltransferase